MARDVYEDHDETTATRPEGLGNALIYLTFLILATALFLSQNVLKKHFNVGMFADKGQQLDGA